MLLHSSSKDGLWTDGRSAAHTAHAMIGIGIQSLKPLKSNMPMMLITGGLTVQVSWLGLSPHVLSLHVLYELGDLSSIHKWGYFRLQLERSMGKDIISTTANHVRPVPIPSIQLCPDLHPMPISLVPDSLPSPKHVVLSPTVFPQYNCFLAQCQ